VVPGQAGKLDAGCCFFLASHIYSKSLCWLGSLSSAYVSIKAVLEVECSVRV
jgi:hypothetical protein